MIFICCSDTTALIPACFRPLPPEGEGWGEGLFHCSPNRLQHAVNVLVHIAVPKPKYCEPEIVEGLIAHNIPLRFNRMPGPINFDNKLSLKANEIDDVWTERMLTTELTVIYLAGPHAGPNLLFSGCLPVTQAL